MKLQFIFLTPWDWLIFNTGQRGWEKCFFSCTCERLHRFQVTSTCTMQPFLHGQEPAAVTILGIISCLSWIFGALTNSTQHTDNHFGPGCPLIFSKFRRTLSSHGLYLKLLTFVTKSLVNMCKERQQQRDCQHVNLSSFWFNGVASYFKHASENWICCSKIIKWPLLSFSIFFQNKAVLLFWIVSIHVFFP